MVDEKPRAGGPKLVGGTLCLDFVNTVDWRIGGKSEERLTGYDELVAWAEQAGALTPDEAEGLRREAHRRASEAEAVLQRAIALREATYRLFAAVAAGQEVEGGDLAVLSAALADALPHLRLRRGGRGFAWAWEARPALERMLWPVVRSAEELLTSPELGRVRQCADDSCGWLFLDMSRNRSRRWCAMEDCGNRAKARRHYRRKTGAG